jgi:glutathione reductase (NADPH)
VIVSATTRNVPSIYAVGDVTNRVQLTPVALGEAMVVVDQLFGPVAGKPAREMSYEFIPTAVFTHPNIGTVGYTEAAARETFGQIAVFRSEFKALRHTLSGSSERTLMKLVVDSASDRVVGLHMVGAEAGEIVQGFAVAMKAGATKAVFDATIGIHPTAAEEFVTMREAVRR